MTVDRQAGTIEVEFDAKPDFTIPSGLIQGGVIAAMLVDTLGPAAFAMTGGGRLSKTIDLHVHYVRPIPPGRVTTKGKVVKLGASIAFLEGELFDAT